MSVEELKKKEWILNRENGLIFLRHDLLRESVDFASYSPTTEEILAGRKLTPVAPVLALDVEEEGDDFADLDAAKRAFTIKQAVQAVLPEDYGKAAFGKPAMPKVAEIKAATGLDDVTAEEIIAALPVVVAIEGA